MLGHGCLGEFALGEFDLGNAPPITSPIDPDRIVRARNGLPRIVVESKENRVAMTKA